MNRQDLISKIAEDASITKTRANEVLDSMLNVIQDALIEDGNVLLVNFGSFKVFTKKARKGRNPKTGEELNIPEKKVVRFKPGVELRNAVKGDM